MAEKELFHEPDATDAGEPGKMQGGMAWRIRGAGLDGGLGQQRFQP